MRTMRSCLLVASCCVLAPFILYFSVIFIMCGATYYAPKFNQNKFNSLRPGMSSGELEKVMGPPLEKIRRRDGSVLWAYSGRADVSCSYWRRLVMVRDEKITSIANDYWEE